MAKPAALYFWSSIAFINFATNQLQALYSDDRPYWTYVDIISTNCLIGYGNPSDTMMRSTFIWTTLYLHVYYDIGV